MNKMKHVLSNKPITYPETTAFVVINKAQLMPVSSKKPVDTYGRNEKQKLLPSIPGKSVGVCSHNINSKLQLPSIGSENSSAAIPTFRQGETLTVRSNKSNRNGSCIASSRLKLPPISSENPPSATSKFKQKGALTTRLNASNRKDSCIANNKPKLPPISCTNRRKKVSFVETSNSFSTVTVTTGSDTEQVSNPSTNEAQTLSNYKHSKERSQVPICRHFRLVWLISKAVKSTLNFEHSIRQLQLSIDTINPFMDPEQCIDFLRKKTDETIFLIASSDLGQSTIPHVHEMSQLNSIYILGKKKRQQKQWIKNWTKIKDIYSSIDSICEILKRDTQQRRRDSIAISMSSIDLNHLDPSYMYTRVLKEILLEMKYDDQAKKEFVQFCRRKLDANNSYDPIVIDEFERDHDMHTSIWWYTRDCFLYEMINRAFRLQEIDVIIKAGFFIQDLQKQIEILYNQPTEKTILYRGQGLSEIDFEQLCIRRGGLFSFNNFLSTSTDQNVARLYAESSRENFELIGIIFQIEVDPLILTSTRWASVADKSYYCNAEREILFAMHSVFRVGEINKLESRLWQVQLLLTSDDDEELKKLTEYIRQETQGSTGWDRLGKLLLKMGNFIKAEEVFNILIENTIEDDKDALGHRYYMMGLLNKGKCDYEKALLYYDKALEIYKTYPGSNHLDLATVYNNIGEIYKHMENYSKALENFQTALNIQKSCEPLHNSNLVVTHGNIAEAYKNLEKYTDALNFYQRILSVQKKSIPLNVLNLGITYTSIAEMLYHIKDYSKALKLFRKVSRIQQYNCSPNNTDIAMNNNNMGQVYEKLEEYSNALEHYEKALDVLRKLHSSNVSELAIIYDNLARTYKNMNAYRKALEFYQKLLIILERYPHLKQPDLAATHDNVGQTHKSIGELEKALLSYRKAIAIARKSTPPDHYQLRLYKEHLAEV